MLLPEGSKHGLLKWIYGVLHILEQIQHLHYKQCQKNEKTCSYTVRRELFRDQQERCRVQLAVKFSSSSDGRQRAYLTQ